MEIRQIKKEIDIRPASYLDENAENTEESGIQKNPFEISSIISSN